MLANFLNGLTTSFLIINQVCLQVNVCVFFRHRRVCGERPGLWVRCAVCQRRARLQVRLPRWLQRRSAALLLPEPGALYQRQRLYCQREVCSAWRVCLPATILHRRYWREQVQEWVVWFKYQCFIVYFFSCYFPKKFKSFLCYSKLM